MILSTYNDSQYSIGLFPHVGQRLFGRVQALLTSKKGRENRLSAVCPFSVSLRLRDQSEFHVSQNQPQNAESSGGRICNIVRKIMHAFISRLNENTITYMYSFDTVKLELLKHQPSTISQFDKAGKIKLKKKRRIVDIDEPQHFISWHQFTVRNCI